MAESPATWGKAEKVIDSDAVPCRASLRGICLQLTHGLPLCRRGECRDGEINDMLAAQPRRPLMENPATWDEATKVIDQAITNANRAALRGVVGWSMAKQIAEALRQAGLLKEDHAPPG